MGGKTDELHTAEALQRGRDLRNVVFAVEADRKLELRNRECGKSQGVRGGVRPDDGVSCDRSRA